MSNSYEGFYDGGGSSFNSEYGIGFKMSASQLGFSVNPQTANQLGDTMNAIKQGTKVFEVSMLMPDVTETIPTQHFKEMKAIMKLSGVKPSVHGPMIDPAGFDEKGNWKQEIGRADNERRMFDTIEKAAILDSDGSVPVVFHSSAGAPGAEWRPGDKEKGENDRIMEKGVAINKETGEATLLNREYKFRPEHPELLEKGGDVVGRNKDGSYKDDFIEGAKGKLFDAESTVDSVNAAKWENQLVEVAQMSKHASELMETPALNLHDYKDAYIVEGTRDIVDAKTGEKLDYFNSEDGQADYYNKMRSAGLFLENAELSFAAAFNQAYKYGSPEQQKELKKLSEEYSKKSDESRDMIPLGDGKVGVGIWTPVKRQGLVDDSLRELQRITREGRAPELFQESNEFALDKAARTFGNLAAKSYDELGKDKAPVLAIEPFHPGAGLSETKDMVELVKRSRENFAGQLVDKGMGKKAAAKIAADKIGVTWDVGHINMIKKHGFTDKDIVADTKEIAPMVKHVHLTDNFGHADTHLVPGMGNSPIKKILEELEKTGRLDEMKKITEAGGFFQHFKTSPHPLTMGAFGSGIYGMKAGATWNEAAGIQGAYNGGYGNLNPGIHHQYFGAGFTTMPVELGGQMPGGDSRFGGAPMA